MPGSKERYIHTLVGSCLVLTLASCEDPLPPPGPIEDFWMATKAAHWIHGVMCDFYFLIPSSAGAVDEIHDGSDGGWVHVTGGTWYDGYSYERNLTFEFHEYESGPLYIDGTLVYDYYQFITDTDWLAYTDNRGDVHVRVVTKRRGEGDMGNDVRDVDDVFSLIHIVNDGNFFHQIIGEMVGLTGEEQDIWHNVYDWSRVY